MKPAVLRFLTLCKRAWRICIKPPKESQIYLKLEDLPTLSHRLSSCKTGAGPKQVVAIPSRNLALVSCMQGRRLQAFSYQDGNFELTKEWEFPDQCVEVAVAGNLCLTTTTNFARGSAQRSHLTLVDLATGDILSTVDTGGEWSKVVKVHPNGKWAFVSNWHSHDISIVDIRDPHNPRVRQILACGESPRGMAFAEDGTCFIGGYYSARLYKIQQRGDEFVVGDSSPKFDPEGYRGNMRDIYLDPQQRCAWVSNMGRNLVHAISMDKLSFDSETLVGRFPNSIALWEKGTQRVLLVSCRKEQAVVFVDTATRQVVGKSAPTGREPTGLTTIPDGFLVTSFKDNTLEYHENSRL